MVKKILVVTNGNIGDFVMASSALKLLRQFSNDTKITLIISIKVKDFVENLNLTDSIIYTDFSFTKNLLNQRLDQTIWFFKNYFKIKKEQFNDCIFLDHSKFFAKAIPFLGIKNLIGPSTWWCGNNIINPNIKKLNRVVSLPNNSDTLHMSERYQTIVRTYLGICNLAKPVLPKTNELATKTASRLLSKTKRYAVVFSLSGDNIKGHKKTYPPEYGIKIIDVLSKEFDIDFYIIGTKDNYSDAEYIKNKLTNIKIHNLSGKTSLLELKSIFEQTDLLISVDTGTIHIAATTHINIIGLYGSTNPHNSCPMTNKAQLLYIKQNCSPCNYTRTVLKIPCQFKDNPKCLAAIKPEMVIEATREILKPEFIGLSKKVY
jgi:ADP-heptose:LPS heptosyltransferase